VYYAAFRCPAEAARLVNSVRTFGKSAAKPEEPRILQAGGFIMTKIEIGMPEKNAAVSLDWAQAIFTNMRLSSF
jgi:hypothetical protein